MGSAEISAYAQAAGSGRYDRVTGLRGKYDNVRTYWEDQSLRLRLRPHLQTLVDCRLKQGRDVRIVDLGCGSGDGFETLMSLRRGDVRGQDHQAELIPPRHLGRYLGMELNPALLEQAQVRHAQQQAARFLQADLRQSPRFPEDEEAFDVYFASFGTLSHLNEDDTVSVLAEIARHAEHGSLLMADWLGRFAYEWTDLWNADTSGEHWMDYRISYIYSEQERTTREIDSFPLRLLAPDEVRRIFKRVEDETGVALVEKDLFDRSLFVGRHMETGDYNRHARPLRSAVNRLHEPQCRTDLETLLFDLHLPDGFPGARGELETIHAAWNALVHFTREALVRADASAPLPQPPDSIPDVARRAMMRMHKVVEAMEWVEADDPRAEWVEPQLGLALRNIELQGQRAAGCGHGLVAICEVQKR